MNLGASNSAFPLWKNTWPGGGDEEGGKPASEKGSKELLESEYSIEGFGSSGPESRQLNYFVSFRIILYHFVYYTKCYEYNVLYEMLRNDKSNYEIIRITTLQYETIRKSKNKYEMSFISKHFVLYFVLSSDVSITFSDLRINSRKFWSSNHTFSSNSAKESTQNDKKLYYIYLLAGVSDSFTTTSFCWAIITRPLSFAPCTSVRKFRATCPLLPWRLFPTASHGFSRESQLHYGRTDRSLGSGDGSRLYEVNKWEFWARNAKV
jgi:hypothetical protein